MTAKLTANGKTIEVELTCEQQSQIDKLCKNEFEIDYKGVVCSWENYNTDIRDVYSNPHPPRFDLGVCRKTIELAKQAQLLSQQTMRLDELVKWLEPEWKADWEDSGQKKYYIHFSKTTGQFGVSWNTTYRLIGTVYMPTDPARKILDALNNGKLPELAEILKGE